jgi:site-specific DNA recombinase
MDLIRSRPSGDASGPLRLPAAMVEDAVVGEVRRLIRTPEIAARTHQTLCEARPDLDLATVVSALSGFDQLWCSLFPAEQSRIVHLLVSRVTVGESGIAVDLRLDGLGSIARDLIAPRSKAAA